MIEELVLLGVSSVIALLALAMVGWEAVSRRGLSLDGLCLSLICLTLAAAFGGNVAWSFFTGDLQRAMGRLGKGAGAKAEPGQSHPPSV